MHNFLRNMTPRSSELRGSWGFTVMATVLLSLGAGATTAAFTLMNGATSHSAPCVDDWTTIQISDDPSTALSASVPLSVEMQEQLSDAHQTSYESAGDAVGSWLDVAVDMGGRPFALLFAAGALALLVACARGAASLLAAPPGFLAQAGSMLGALLVAALLINVLGLPALGIRAVAFAIGASLVAAKFARIARKHLVPAAA
jgi:hypothetical protein